MPDYSQYHILGAFAVGIALAVAYREWSESAWYNGENAQILLKREHRLLSELAKINDLDTLKKSLTELESSLQHGAGRIKEGIEGCIGDTPLIKIKSLSDLTGCEILAKAEVMFGSAHKECPY